MTRFLHISRIIFTDNSTLADKDAAIIDGFLVVENESGKLPTWFSLNEIAVLEGVSLSKNQMKIN